MRSLRRLLVAALFVVALYAGWDIAAKNATPVAIDMLVWQFAEVHLWLALLVSFGAGVAVTGVVALYRLARLRLLARRYRKTLNGLEAEVHQLRNLPLTGDAPAAESAASDATRPLERGT